MRHVCVDKRRNQPFPPWKLPSIHLGGITCCRWTVTQLQLGNGEFNSSRHSIHYGWTLRTWTTWHLYFGQLTFKTVVLFPYLASVYLIYFYPSLILQHPNLRFQIENANEAQTPKLLWNPAAEIRPIRKWMPRSTYASTNLTLSHETLQVTGHSCFWLHHCVAQHIFFSHQNSDIKKRNDAISFPYLRS